MKPKKILMLVALEAELGTENVAILAKQCDLRMTGMGKLLAFEATLAALKGKEYDAIINIGTCGSPPLCYRATAKVCCTGRCIYRP